jgi:TIR domain
MKVFISYRRGDSKDFAGRLADRLRAEPQIDEIFLDIDAIELGEPFKDKITKSLKKCGVCLVLIGSEWRGESASGAQARIFDDGDFVRLEVAEALASSVKTIPVLVNGAAMPSVADLPLDLQKLPSLNAISVRHESFRRDADFLTDAMLSRKEPSPLARYWNRHPFQEGVVRSGFGLITAAALVLGAAVAYHAATGNALDQLLGDKWTVAMAVAGVLSVGIVGPLIFRRRRRRAGS